MPKGICVTARILDDRTYDAIASGELRWWERIADDFWHKFRFQLFTSGGPYWRSSCCCPTACLQKPDWFAAKARRLVSKSPTAQL